MSNADSQPHIDGNKEKGFSDAVEALVPLFLLATVLAIYWQVTDHGFINFRDGFAVEDNPYVRGGFSREAVAWAFTTVWEGAWQPLVWLSHMLDWELYGSYPGWHHLTNVFFHSVNTLLLFQVLKKMTGVVWPSVFVAAVFAVHPVNVETVAWVAERTRALSAFFWLLTLWCYVRHAEKPGAGRYLPCVFLFVLGLMTGPLAMTLPFIFLALDYWPLNRFQFSPESNAAVSDKPKQRTSRLLWEKAPFVALAVLSGAAVFILLRQGGGGASADGPLFGISWAGVPLFYVACLGKIVWPQSLAVLYPALGTAAFWPAAGAWMFVLGICVLGVWLLRKKPYVFAGWFWFLVALAPAAIFREACGSLTAADRFAYIPLIGIAVIIAWGFSRIVEGRKVGRIILCFGAIIVLSSLAGLAWLQAGRWQDSLTLFTHAVKVNPESPIGRNKLGLALACRGNHTEAIRQLTEALRLKPDYAEAHANIGLAFNEQARFQEAIGHFSEALRIDPQYADAHAHWAFALTRNGLLKEAKRHYGEALRIDPDNAEAHNNLGVVLYGEGRFQEALSHYSEALRIRPDYGDAQKNLYILRRLMGLPPRVPREEGGRKNSK